MISRWLRLWQKAAPGATPGFVPAALPADTRVYAVGDVHGRLDLLRRLEAQIHADAAARPGPRHLVIVMLGDYVDRGPETRGVIDHLLRPPQAGFERLHLIGNHDWWLRQFVDADGPLLPWLLSGADAALRSYGVAPEVQPNDPESVALLRRRLGRRMPPSHRRFLQQLRPSLRIGDYLFAHAGIRPGLPLDRQELHDLMFIREPFLSEPSDLGVVVVHGHTVVPSPVLRHNRIGIDTGAYRTGRLTAVAIDADGIRFLSTAE